MRKNKKSLYSLLIVLFLCLGVGYAALTTNLSINGISHVSNASWDVHWENVQVTTGSVSAGTPTISNQTTVSYEITLSQPGDYYEFTVDAVNDGTIDAMIESITSTLNGNPITSLPTYLEYSVEYSDGEEIENNHLLRAGETEVYKIRVQYKTNLNPSDLPGTDQDISLTFEVDYVQSTDDAIQRKPE